MKTLAGAINVQDSAGAGLYPDSAPSAERAAQRLAQLEHLTASLADALTQDDVAEVIVAHGFSSLNASAGAVVLLDDSHTHLTVLRAEGYPQFMLDAWRTMPLDVALPLTDAVRSGEPVWLVSGEQSAARYPHLRDAFGEAGLCSRAAIPLCGVFGTIGALGLSFARPQVFDPGDRSYVQTVARLCAQALERARGQEADRRAQASEAQFRSLVQHTSDLITVVDQTGMIQYINPAVERISGYAPEELIGTLADNLIHPDDLPLTRQAVAERLADPDKPITPLVVRSRHRDGTWRWFEAITTGMVVEGGVTRFIISSRDITARRQAEEAVRQSEARARSYLQNVSDIITVFGRDGCVQFVSPSVERVLGFRPEDLIGTNPGSLVHPEDRVRLRDVMAAIPATEGVLPPIDLRVRHRDGSWRSLEAVANNLIHDPDVAGLVVTFRDTTERRRMLEELRYQAFHDDLTGLANRAEFTDRLREASAEVRRGETGIALLFVDLDDFKEINDQYGHPAGDDVLATVGRRLRRCVRPGDTVARYGGDEFTVLMKGINGTADATVVAERIRVVLAEPVTIFGREVSLTASIGVAVSVPAAPGMATDAPGVTADTLIWRADLAVYEAKSLGKARTIVFDDRMQSVALSRVEEANALRRALAEGELQLWYQPEINLRTGAVVAWEALVRWQHPARGLVDPVDFIAMAEETGLILPVGQWVLQEACRQARSWGMTSLKAAAPVMSVNVSARQFQQPDFLDQVRDALETHGIPPARLRLEITETALMQDADGSVRMLHDLKDLGVQLAIDDFGTGYSSLNYLRRFPVDVVKIDRSFIADLGLHAGTTAIVEAVIRVAHTMGMTITTEGIETGGQALLARKLDCDSGQGHYFSQPRPAATIVPWYGSWVAAMAKAMPSLNRAQQT